MARSPVDAPKAGLTGALRQLVYSPEPVPTVPTVPSVVLVAVVPWKPTTVTGVGRSVLVPSPSCPDQL